MQQERCCVAATDLAQELFYSLQTTFQVLNIAAQHSVHVYCILKKDAAHLLGGATGRTGSSSYPHSFPSRAHVEHIRPTCVIPSPGGRQSLSYEPAETPTTNCITSAGLYIAIREI